MNRYKIRSILVFRSPEKLYDDTNEKIDEIAKRIYMLNGVPALNFRKYSKTSKIKESVCLTTHDADQKNVPYTYVTLSNLNVLSEN